MKALKLGKFIDKDLLSIDDGKGRLSVFSLALPLFFESIGSHLIGVIQTMLSSNYQGGILVIPSSLAGQVQGLYINVIMLICTGMSIILSLYLGKGKSVECRNIIGTALVSFAVLNVFFCVIIMLFAEPLLVIMGANKAEYVIFKPYAVKYLRYRMITMALFQWVSIITYSLRCYGYTKVGLISGLSANIVSAILTAIVLYVINIPLDIAVEVMVLGVGLVSSLVNVGLALIIFIKKKIPISLRFSFKWFKKILVIGTPAAISAISYALSQTLTTIITTNLSPSAYLAKSYVTQLVYFVYIFGWSIGQSNSIMVGRLCGMGDLDKVNRMHRQNLRIVLLFNGALSLLFAGVGPFILKYFYAAEQAVIIYSLAIFFIDTAVELGRGMNHIGQNGLNATGDVNFTTVISMLSCWVFGVGSAWLFVVVFKWDLYGIWIAFALDELFRGVLYYIRWRKGKWRSRVFHEIEVLEKPEEERHFHLPQIDSKKKED